MSIIHPSICNAVASIEDASKRSVFMAVKQSPKVTTVQAEVEVTEGMVFLSLQTHISITSI